MRAEDYRFRRIKFIELSSEEGIYFSMIGISDSGHRSTRIQDKSLAPV